MIVTGGLVVDVAAVVVRVCFGKLVDLHSVDAAVVAPVSAGVPVGFGYHVRFRQAVVVEDGLAVAPQGVVVGVVLFVFAVAVVVAAAVVVPLFVVLVTVPAAVVGVDPGVGVSVCCIVD